MKKKKREEIKIMAYDSETDKLVELTDKEPFKKGFIKVTPASPIWDLVKAIHNSNNINNENHV
jgi:hypothetical protein